LDKLQDNSWTPAKKAKYHPLTPEEKIANRKLARGQNLAE